MTRRLESRFLRNSFFFSLALLVILAALGVARRAWLSSYESRSEARAKQTALAVGTHMATGRPLTEDMYRRLIEEEPRIGYVAVANYRTGYRSGAVNSKGLETGGAKIAAFLAARGDSETLSHLIRKDGGFAGEYLDVYSVALLPPATQSERTPLGAFKIGYLLPGFPYGRGFLHLWVLASAIVGLAAIVLAAAWTAGRRRQTAAMEIVRIPSTDLEDLEIASADDTTSIIDEMGREWRPLFDGNSLDGWVPQGEWYISEREIAGVPWGSSLIYPDLTLGGSYGFQLWAKKVAGPDGFVVLFVCDGKPLVWVLGGWENNRSELVGYEGTRSDLSLERFLWYKLEVRVGTEWVEGAVEDKVVFKLSRSAITHPSPELGFQKGLGIGVWSTLAKFKELRFLSM
ncbi:MAG: hypothetical protein V1798_06280 [Pseudomonadota bacterium]